MRLSKDILFDSRHCISTEHIIAPYGYCLKDNTLLIEETEAMAVRLIYRKFTSSKIEYGGIANYMNLQGIKKVIRQNGKLAYGRHVREKIKGTKNDYRLTQADNYIPAAGQHEAIISEEVWQKTHSKRMETGTKHSSRVGKDRAHLLTGILKCPKCGGPMHTNKNSRLTSVTANGN